MAFEFVEGEAVAEEGAEVAELDCGFAEGGKGLCPSSLASVRSRHAAVGLGDTGEDVGFGVFGGVGGEL